MTEKNTIIIVNAIKLLRKGHDLDLACQIYPILKEKDKNGRFKINILNLWRQDYESYRNKSERRLVSF